ncbi:SusC/RagA family TonB-linked outer membrane protein [Poritiphilus flavus]|uniref:SusC/RagA family TonB-linked outer membrane protein n=1 Tax=Poritiphilus flavus TaxID=2697053 RepID=A0A6L9ED32_9FLAO|nr:SusC/RagA family TonB-linked outer membrane protein [Poritiphilus flavus]NAS12299.1 SusC/RagA family TonB-linked outer membrane protein [Poritiphilus flavus]
MNEKTSRLLLMLFLIPLWVLSQDGVTGTVTEEGTNEPLPGVNVIIKGTTTGTTTDFDGVYQISANIGDILIFSYIGFRTVEVTVTSGNLDISLTEDAAALEEVVVIGYGTTTKKDATGSVIGVTEEELNQGFIASPQDLLVGKAAGVNITTNGGAPGSGSQIRIRGGSSLDASNDPLIIIDGVPLDSPGLDEQRNSGSRNVFDFVNPNDISSFSILKDASATAIYGSRASNGVIIITTKKGTTGDLKFSLNSSVSVNTLKEVVGVFSAEDYRELIGQRLPGRVEDLGQANTNWQEQIFSSATGTDTNFSVSGGIKGIPFRASIGYTQLDGILKTEALERTTLALNVTPRLFDDKLKIEINGRGSYVENNFADTGAIGSALEFDPTQPVFASDLPGGFFDYYEADGSATTNTINNPLALLELRDNNAIARRFVGNAKFDYNLHFFPDITATLNLGIDKSIGDGTDNQPATLAAQAIVDGRIRTFEQDEENKLMDVYLKYAKEFEKINSRLDFTAGYSYQNFYEDRMSVDLRGDGVGDPLVINTILESNLQSFFGRFNYTFKDRYLLTLTYRRDGSSRFGGDNRWGNFPAAALAWNISDESFLANSNTLSNLKLRLGWGITGQQDVLQGTDTQPFLPQFAPSENGASTQLGQDANGNPIFVTTIRAQPFDANIKWEETTTYNIGMDFGLFDNRISGAIELYYRETEDLLSTVNVAAGSNLTNRLPTNIGSLTNKGVEFFLDAAVFDTQDFNWNLGFNFAYNENEIDRLFQTGNDPGSGIPVSGTSLIGIGGDDGAQWHLVGQPTRSYFVFEQIYDEQGRPIEGVVRDLNNDGVINDLDRRPYKQAAPLAVFGLNSRFTYKQFDFSFSARANYGNYNYNGIDLNRGNYRNLNVGQDLRNVATSVLQSNFEGTSNQITFSDYYVRDASFIRMDNMTLGYTFNNLWKEDARMRIFSTLQNVFVITDYDGLDPEITNGIDNNIYPRPFTIQAGLSLDF